MEKLLNAKLKLKREEVAIRAAILRREQEQKELDLEFFRSRIFDDIWVLARVRLEHITSKNNQGYKYTQYIPYNHFMSGLSQYIKEKYK